jgi:hypothetical protein
MIKSDTKTLVAAMRILAEDIQSEDGVANLAISEAADRLEELEEQLKEAQDYADKLVEHKDMVCLPKDLENLREANSHFATENHILKEQQRMSESNPNTIKIWL